MPATDVEALASPLMGLFEKRRARKFFMFVQDYEEDSPATHQGMDLNTTSAQAVFEYILLSPHSPLILLSFCSQSPLIYLSFSAHPPLISLLFSSHSPPVLPSLLSPFSFSDMCIECMLYRSASLLCFAALHGLHKNVMANESDGVKM